MTDIPSMFGVYDTYRRNLTIMTYVENQAFLGSYAYDRASAASLILLGIDVIIAIVVYFLLLRDKDEVKLKKLIRAERKGLKKGM